MSFNIRKFSYVIVCCIFATPSAWAQLGLPSKAELNKLDGRIESYMKENKVPGGLITVVSGGQIIHQKSYGLANLELSVPVSNSTLFEIGSISKQFVSAATMLLVEEKKLSLEDPIHKYLPDLPSEWLGITVKQLLNHTSGIPDYEEIRSYDVYRYRLTPQDVIAIAQSRPVDFEPGQGYYYSNTAYYLASMIVERIEGQPLGKVLKTRIFDPLGMTSTRMADPETIIKNRAEGYWVNKIGELINRNPTETSSTLGAGGLLSSAADLAKWDAALYDDKILSEQSKKIMWTSAILPDGTDTEYGLGWRITPERGLKTTSHSGQVGGFVAYFSRYIDQKTAIIIFMNRYQVSSRTVKDMVMDTFMPNAKD